MATSHVPAKSDGSAESGLGPGQPWATPGWFTHAFDADTGGGIGPGGRWRINAALPLGHDPTAGPLPALYVLDPLGTFGTAAQVSRTTLLLTGGALRPHAVVGVGPDTDDPLEVLSLRYRDLSPLPDDTLPDPIARHGRGGGEAFADLLTGRIIPAVEQEYGFDPAERGLAGWSLGGLFAAWMALTRPRTFRRYLLVSPSLWWAKGAALDPARVAGADLAGAAVYLAAGEHEAHPTASWPPISPETPPDILALYESIDMVADLRRFADLLRASPSGPATVRAEAIPDEHHATVWPAAYTRGIVALYGAG